GLIFLDPAGQQASGSWDNWRWRLTEVGKEVVETGSWHPRDPDRFLARMHDRAPGLEAAALGYLEEALRAFNARCYLASSVMLGVAAEHVFERVARAFVAAKPDDGAKLKRQLDGSFR
ncbi:MAG: hypothetical protein M3355_05725, partial [Actinomycetota bacterium]|nr:hypothetical protein [Actinomycetota bacterium]